MTSEIQRLMRRRSAVWSAMGVGDLTLLTGIAHGFATMGHFGANIIFWTMLAAFFVIIAIGCLALGPMNREIQQIGDGLDSKE